MDCYLSCSVGLVFLVAAVFTVFFGSIGGAKQVFYAMLSREQQDAYARVITARRNIYLQGLGVGLLLSFLVLRNASGRMPATVPCSAVAITLVTNYLYYILSPKPQNTVVKLAREDQRVAWQNVNRHMQVVYHTGLLFGISAAYFLADGLCTQ